MTRKTLQVFAFVFATSLLVSAQTTTTDRKPSKAIRQFVVMSDQSLADIEQKLKPSNKVEELIGGEGMQVRVAIQHEKDTAGANGELHDASDDVYYVLEGSATLTLGGTLDSPRESEPGEWRSPRINGGQIIQIKKGDLVVVPRGTPHQRSTKGQDFTMILIKIFAEPRAASTK